MFFDKPMKMTLPVSLVPDSNRVRVRVMVFNATVNNISVLWRSALLMEETGVPGENHRPVASH